MGILHHNHKIEGALIIAPKSVYSIWAYDEIKAHYPFEDIDVYLWKTPNSIKERVRDAAFFKKNDSFKFLIMNVEALSAGKGKTGYRVQFAPDGTPVFYTGGESSSEFKQYAPLLAIASLGLAAPSLFAAGAPTAGAAGLSALDAGLGVYGTGAAGTAGGIAGGLSALDAGMGVYGTGGTAGGLAGGLSALDAGMGVYPSTGNIGLSALDAGLGVYPNTGNIGLSALDAGMSVYPNTGNIIPSALDAGMGVYPNTGNIIPSALDAGMGVYPNTGNIGLSALDAGMGVYGTGGTVLPSTGVGTGLENILSNLTRQKRGNK